MSIQGWIDAAAFALALLAFGLVRPPAHARSAAEALVGAVFSLRAVVAVPLLALALGVFMRVHPGSALTLQGALVVLSAAIGVLAWAVLAAVQGRR